MAISDLTGPFGDDERDKALEGEAQDEALDVSAEDAAFDDDDETDAFDDDSAPLDEEDADEVMLDDELPLADEDARLPWLEADEDEEDYAGYSPGQTIALVAAALLVLGLVVGGIWWLSRDKPDSELVADGSTIKSEGPYRQRPDDPGGKVFEGTGDSSFKVSEGQTAPVRLGEGDTGPAPGFETLGKGAKGETAKTADATGKTATAVDSASVGVQVGAYSNRASAEAGWSALAQQHEALGGLRHRVVEGKADIGTVYRLQALAGDAAAATALCGKLKSAGLSCYVKR